MFKGWGLPLFDVVTLILVCLSIVKAGRLSFSGLEYMFHGGCREFSKLSLGVDE